MEINKLPNSENREEIDWGIAEKRFAQNTSFYAQPLLAFILTFARWRHVWRNDTVRE
jgi:hypothetical protein